MRAWKEDGIYVTNQGHGLDGSPQPIINPETNEPGVLAHGIRNDGSVFVAYGDSDEAAREKLNEYLNPDCTCTMPPSSSCPIHAEAGTRRIVFDDISTRASNLTGTLYFEGTVKLEIIDEAGIWHEKDHYWTQWKVSDCLDMPLIWSYFSSAEEVASPIRHSRKEVLREAGIKPWE